MLGSDNMLFYKYLFIFALFCIIGWIGEVIFRSIVNKKIINPGFMSGCVLPIYGIGAIIANLVCICVSKLNSDYKTILIFIISLILLTILELICGYISLKYFHIRLWDYRDLKFNYKGFICIEFSLIWGIASILYYKLAFPCIDSISLNFISSNIGIFFLGIFLGVFLIDLSVSINLFNRLIKYSNEIKENINIEKIKLEARLNTRKKRFLNAIYPHVSTNRYIREKIKEMKENK